MRLIIGVASSMVRRRPICFPLLATQPPGAFGCGEAPASVSIAIEEIRGAWPERDLLTLNFCTIMIDRINFKGHLCWYHLGYALVGRSTYLAFGVEQQETAKLLPYYLRILTGGALI